MPVGRPPRPAVLEAIRRAQDAGVIVTLASGRAPITTRRYASLLGVRAPVICFQGGRVVEPIRGETLMARTLPYSLAQEVLQLAAEARRDLGERWAPLVYQGDTMYLTRLWLSAEAYREFFGPSWTTLSDLAALPRRPVDKIIFVGDPEALDALRPRLATRLGERVTIVRSWTMFLEVTPREATKGHALAWLAEYLGISREETVAVGDADNDLTMIRWAGLGVAMGNAPPEVKAAADVVAPSVEEDGVAWVIDRWILNAGESTSP